MIAKLRELKEKYNLSLDLYKKIYPTHDQPPRFYGLPKVHKNGTPLRPIVSSIGTITYGCAQYLAKVLSPLVGKTAYHVKNSKDFVENLRNYNLLENEEMRSYDVTALFTSVPVDKAMDVIRTRLEGDNTLKHRTIFSPHDIIQLLGMCLNYTYFVYQGQFFLQIHGAAMGSPVSPIVCNLYMESFEQRAIQEALHPPRLWKRYVDDTFTIMNKAESSEFTTHLNSLDADIKWTTESEELVNYGDKTIRQIAFLDSMVVTDEQGTLTTKVYRKNTHTDQYLNFASNHPIEHKRGVIRTLKHRAEGIVSDDQERDKEVTHIKTVLKVNGYPDWLLNERRERGTPTTQTNVPAQSTQKRPPIVIPYIKGVSEQLRRIYKTHHIPTYFKPINTLRQLLVHPKDKLDKERTVGPVYHITCEDCSANYIGESERSLKARFQEHQRPSSTTSEVSRHIHQDHPDHTVKIENTKVLAVEPRWFERGVKEAIYIKLNRPTLNRDSGRHYLPAVWTNLLRNYSDRGARTPQQQ
jgi:hypothetical protein